MVVGRNAARRERDPHVLQYETVVATFARRLGREARAMERGVEEVARSIAGEDASRAIRAVRAGREPEDDQLRVPIAEAIHGTTPVLVGEIRASLLDRDRLAMRDEARARATRVDLFGEHRDGRCLHRAAVA